MSRPRHTFIPLDIQCFWCNGHMKRGMCRTGFGIDTVTYFCEDCGAVSHFAVSDKVKISSIEVEYKAAKPVRNQETKPQGAKPRASEGNKGVSNLHVPPQVSTFADISRFFQPLFNASGTKFKPLFKSRRTFPAPKLQLILRNPAK